MGGDQLVTATATARIIQKLIVMHPGGVLRLRDAVVEEIFMRAGVVRPDIDDTC